MVTGLTFFALCDVALYAVMIYAVMIYAVLLALSIARRKRTVVDLPPPPQPDDFYSAPATSD
jgi:hypothetical protein